MRKHTVDLVGIQYNSSGLFANPIADLNGLSPQFLNNKQLCDIQYIQSIIKHAYRVGYADGCDTGARTVLDDLEFDCHIALRIAYDDIVQKIPDISAYQTQNGEMEKHNFVDNGYKNAEVIADYSEKKDEASDEIYIPNFSDIENIPDNPAFFNQNSIFYPQSQEMPRQKVVIGFV